MFAQVATFQTRPDQVDAAIRNFRERVLPETQKQKGFKGMLLLVERKRGNTLGITLWESEADMKASEKRVQDVGIGGAPTVHHFEVAEHI